MTPGTVDTQSQEAFPGVIWALGFREDGAPFPLRGRDPFADPPHLAWLHVNLVDQRCCRWLSSRAELPAAARDFLLTRTPQAFFASEEGTLLVALDDFTRDEGSLAAMRTGILHLVARERLVITGRHVPLRATDKVGMMGERGQIGATSAAELVGHILDEQAYLLDTIVTELDHTAQSIEDLLLLREYSDQGRLVTLRRRLVQMHRLLRGTRATLHRLERDRPSDVPTGFISLAERFVQRYEALDADVVSIQEQARLLQEEINTARAEESNKSLALLSGMTAIFLPPTLVTGYFGMNSADLPLTETPGGTIVSSALVLISMYLTYRLLKRNRFL